MIEKNIGQWTAQVSIEGKAPSLIVNGVFPTNGEKPIFRLEEAVPQGINPKILLMNLQFGSVIDENGKGTGTVHFDKILESTKQYDSVEVHVDGKKPRLIAHIKVFQAPVGI